MADCSSRAGWWSSAWPRPMAARRDARALVIRPAPHGPITPPGRRRVRRLADHRSIFTGVGGSGPGERQSLRAATQIRSNMAAARHDWPAGPSSLPPAGRCSSAGRDRRRQDRRLRPGARSAPHRGPRRWARAEGHHERERRIALRPLLGGDRSRPAWGPRNCQARACAGGIGPVASARRHQPGGIGPTASARRHRPGGIGITRACATPPRQPANGQRHAGSAGSSSAGFPVLVGREPRADRRPHALPGGPASRWHGKPAAGLNPAGSDTLSRTVSVDRNPGCRRRVPDLLRPVAGSGDLAPWPAVVPVKDRRSISKTQGTLRFFEFFMVFRTSDGGCL